MRILQIVNSISGGGAERLAWDLHRVYLRRGHESAIIALSGSAEGEHIHSAGYSSPYHPFASVKAAEILKKHFPDPTAVHVHLFPSLLTVPRVLRRRGYRGSLVATEHSTSNRRRGTIRGKVLDELTYKPYSRIVCISRAVEEALVTWKPRVKGRTVVIHNGVPLERFTSPERTCYHEPPVILTAGRITEAKNCFRALKAVGILAESSDIPFKWIVAGDGPLLDDLRKKASELVSKGLAEFHGQSDNIPQLMESADIFFMPSLWEGFGMAAVEAMASGLPVVAGDVPGLRDVVGKETGLLVDPTSCENMARALEYLLKNPENALSMGSRGTVRASSYSIEKCAERHLELYRKLSIRAEQ